MEFFDLVLCISFILIMTQVLLLFRDLVSKKRKLPPGPRGFPLVGSLFQIGSRPHVSFAEIAKAYGPLMSVRLGSVTTIVASSPETAKEVLQKNDHALAGRTIPDSASAEAHHEMPLAWLPPESTWRTVRKIMSTQIMTTQKLDELQGLRNEKTVELVQHVREIAAAGQAVNIGWLAFATSFNMISSTVFSINLVDLKSKGNQEFKDNMSKIMELSAKPNLSDYFPWHRPFDLQRYRSSVKFYFKRLNALVNGMVEQRLRCRETTQDRKNDFLDAILDYSQEHGSDLHRRQLNLLILDLLVGGTDTTATTVEWIMAELLHNPDAMAKAQQELADVIGPERSIQESDIPRLPYLQAVVKEAIRIHPTAPLLIPHKAVADVELCGFTIPKNTQVLVNAWAITRDPSIWKDPLSFKPERFLEHDIDFRDGNFGFIPFGAGRRICPGITMAVRMVNLMVGTLIHSFRWKLPKGVLPHEMDMSDRFGVTLQKANPLLAIPF